MRSPTATPASPQRPTAADEPETTMQDEVVFLREGYTVLMNQVAENKMRFSRLEDHFQEIMKTLGKRPVTETSPTENRRSVPESSNHNHQVQGMHTNAAALKKPSILHEASRILNEEGLKAFWKGNLVTIAHRLPYSSVNFYTYEHYKKFLYMVTGMENHRESISSNVFVHFVAGGLAGITAASATYPLDLVRTRLAAQTKVIYYTGIWNTLRTISTDEGILGLYKGLGTTLVGVGPSIAISFSAYESLRSYWMSNRPHDSPVVVSLACGSLSGIASSTATFPLDLVRRRKQLEGIGGRAVVYKTGLLGTLKRIVKTEGVRGLYRGILPEYYKVVPGVGICFMTYETLKLYFMDLSSKL